MTRPPFFPRLVVGPLGIMRVVRTEEAYLRHMKYTLIVNLIFGVLMIVAIISFGFMLFAMVDYAARHG